MAEVKRLRDRPSFATKKEAAEARAARESEARRRAPATIKEFDRMTPAEKDQALRVLLIRFGLAR
jgi:hypothetical protein